MRSFPSARGPATDGSPRFTLMSANLPSDDGYFGEAVASGYDSSYGEEFDPAVIAATVDLLAELAGTGRALELGIGTGRIALPLAQRGVRVHGIDLSRAMVERLRAKSG